VIEEGSLADLILVDGNPLEDLSLVADPERRFQVIMKDGVVYKDTLPPEVGRRLNDDELRPHDRPDAGHRS
jgi:hypothetical protein